MPHLNLRTLDPGRDRDAVASLIHRSTNAWYRAHRGVDAFACPPDACRIFCDTYDALDPGEGLVVEDADTGEIVGSAFVHPRDTHISLGIVNVAPERFGQGIARRMIDAAVARSERVGKPLRLVSSAMNLDSFSLYTRAGFVPRQLFQDLVLTVPEGGLAGDTPAGVDRVRPGRIGDAPALAEVEARLAGIRRERDIAHFLENRDGIWSVRVIEDANGAPTGWLAASAHPASRIVGPGVVATEADAAALLWAHLDDQRGHTPLFLVPADAAELVATAYRWGARNVEMHVAQVRGAWTKPSGIVFPTFLPETG